MQITVRETRVWILRKTSIWEYDTVISEILLYSNHLITIKAIILELRNGDSGWSWTGTCSLQTCSSPSETIMVRTKIIKTYSGLYQLLARCFPVSYQHQLCYNDFLASVSETVAHNFGWGRQQSFLSLFGTLSSSFHQTPMAEIFATGLKGCRSTANAPNKVNSTVWPLKKQSKEI